ncbi:MAG TPA: hypothetical protein VE842_10650 [Pyrinomonadaceae bacterium]|nr:hypothetical protein [Pyrinomonadaceae bacterium]
MVESGRDVRLDTASRARIESHTCYIITAENRNNGLRSVREAWPFDLKTISIRRLILLFPRSKD